MHLGAKKGFVGAAFSVVDVKHLGRCFKWKKKKKFPERKMIEVEFVSKKQSSGTSAQRALEDTGQDCIFFRRLVSSQDTFLWLRSQTVEPLKHSQACTPALYRNLPFMCFKTD